MIIYTQEILFDYKFFRGGQLSSREKLTLRNLAVFRGLRGSFLNTNKKECKEMAKRKGKSKHTLIKVIALSLVLVAVAYVITSLVLAQWNPGKWGKSSKVSDEPQKPVLAICSEGEKLTDGSIYEMGRGLTLLTARDNVKKQEYAPAGEITLTATLSNEYINGEFDWAINFADGRTAANNVSITPDISNRANAKLRFLVPFNEQITVTATLRGSSSSDTCTVDCLRAAALNNWDVSLYDFDDEALFSADVEFNEVGTVKGEFKLNEAVLTLKPGFQDMLNSYLNFKINILPYAQTQKIPAPYQTFNAGGYSVEIIKTEWGDKIAYSDFIEGFDDYDEAHKEAIYYAWYQATENGDFTSWRGNLSLNISFDYIFNGVVATTYYSESDFFTGFLNGSLYGDGIAPSVTLNKNVVFGGQQ